MKITTRGYGLIATLTITAGLTAQWWNPFALGY